MALKDSDQMCQMHPGNMGFDAFLSARKEIGNGINRPALWVLSRRQNEVLYLVIPYCRFSYFLNSWTLKCLEIPFCWYLRSLFFGQSTQEVCVFELLRTLQIYRSSTGTFDDYQKTRGHTIGIAFLGCRHEILWMDKIQYQLIGGLSPIIYRASCIPTGAKLILSVQSTIAAC